MQASIADKQSEARQPWSRPGLRRHFTFIGKISPIFRRRRLAAFIELFRPSQQTRILDVGGLPRFWRGSPVESQITVTNLHPLDPYEASFLGENHEFALADATKLPWPDKSFDIVFSNSVIEHLGTMEHQRAFARECQRTGKAHWVQTPAREFPVEPHFFALFIHWLPKPVRRRTVRWFSLWGWLARPRPEVVDKVMDELNLLTFRQFKSLFPQSRFITERILGLPKSFVAYHPPGDSPLAAK